MSQLEDAFVEQFEQDGTMDWIRQQLADAEADESTETPAAEAADTATAEDPPEGEETVVEPEATEEVVEPEATVVAPEEDEDGFFLELDPDEEKWLAKYGYDPEQPETLTPEVLAKAIKGGRNAESLIGKRVEDLSEEKIAQLVEERMSSLLAANEPYPWPDEDDEPEAQVASLRQVAEMAFERQDGEAWQYAMGAWKEVDPLGSEAFATLKAAQLTLLEAKGGSPAVSGGQDELAAGMETLKTKYPALAEPEFQQELGAEIEKYPTLGALLRGELPGVTVDQRLSALDELAGRVASRQTADTVQRSLRRVAVTTSEEARAARAKARVAQQGGRGKPVHEPEDEQIRLGKTGASVGKNDLTERIKQLSGLDVKIGE